MKKIILLIVILIAVISAGLFYYKAEINKDIPESFQDKIVAAHKNILLFNYKKANELYKAAISQDAKPAALEEYLAFLVSREDLNGSYKIAKEVLKNNPNHFLANLVIAAYYVNQNKLEQAINLIKVSAGDQTSFNNAIYAMLSSMNYFIENQNNNFNTISSQIKEQLPDFYYNQLVLYNLLVKDYKNAKVVATNAVTKYPSVDNIILYSKLLYLDNKEDGVKIFKEYLNDNFLTDKSIKTYLEQNSGITDVTLNKVFSDALFRFSKYTSSTLTTAYVDPDNILMTHIALMLNSGNVLARIQAAVYYIQLGDYTTAMEDFNSINKHSFYYRLIYPEIINNLKELGDFNDAINILTTVYNTDKTNPQPLLELGHIYHKQQNYAKAIDYYTTALDVSKNNKQDLGIWLAYYFRGISYHANNNGDKAEADLIAALKLNNKDPLLLNYLGYLWLEDNKNINQAMVMIKTALDKDPKNPNFLDSYAWGLFKQGKYKDALNFALSSQKASPFDPIINDHLGDIYYKLGNKQLANTYWKSVLNMSPDKLTEDAIQQKLAGKLPSYLVTGNNSAVAKSN
ncbi:tetratricopeptide repeat protein [Rickettsiales bacterium LUAb2]